ncbi:MAG: hypothetical protein KBH39_08180 [Chitinophagales bacterium]|nr:hypothetical protein [Chitinophagales bacterium]MBP9550193.1 hypothetical protein [Chitinophagales bacterium]MBP9704667.1 hypothetical protein [Chitinophagales bacterium]
MNYPSYFRSPDGRELVMFSGSNKVTSILINEFPKIDFTEVKMETTTQEVVMRPRILGVYNEVKPLDYVAHLQKAVSILNKKARAL